MNKILKLKNVVILMIMGIALVIMLWAYAGMRHAAGLS